MKSMKLLSGALAVALGVASSASADWAEATVGTTTGDGNVVSALLHLDWDGTDLIVDVSNTSDDGSVITGWGMMGGSIGTGFSAAGTLDDSEWFQANDLSMTPPGQFGTFDFGADSGSAGLNSGTPGAGILADTTATFTFLGLDSSLTSAEDFLTTLNAADLAFAVRWQMVGEDGEDSAKAGGFGAGEGEYPGEDPIPAPGAALLALIGLPLTALYRRHAA